MTIVFIDFFKKKKKMQNLIKKLDKLSIAEASYHLEEFNAKNEKVFTIVENNCPNSDELLHFGNLISSFLAKSIQTLNDIHTDLNSVDLFFRLTVNCLDTIRLVSRDSRAIQSFNNSQLLDLLQKLAELDVNVSKICALTQTDKIESITFKALKSLSNLIFNSKFAQNYYSNDSIRLKLIDFVEKFDVDSVLDSQTLNFDSNSIQINLFKFKILFLVTVFNKELRAKFCNSSQIVFYLMSNIDKISLNRMKTSKSTSHCTLKQVDVLFLIEILKCLYNLSMDIDSVRMEAASILNHFNSTKPNETKSRQLTDNSTEQLFSHLVRILRDLLLCKFESDDLNTAGKMPQSLLLLNKSKLNDLHSNIINLLTNIPTTYFDQLFVSFSDNAEEPENLYSLARNYHEMKRSFRLSQLKSDNSPDDDLINLLKNEQDLNFKGENMEAIAMILSFMSQHVFNYLSKNNQLADTGINKLNDVNIDSIDHLYPVLMVLSLLCKTNKIIRSYCRLKVLPPLKKNDLINLPQNGLTIRNRLCKLMTDPSIQLKRLVAQFLFILCKESVDKLIKYTGFGNAAGLLAETGLMLSGQGEHADYSSDSEESESDEFRKYKNEINPITGRIELDESDEDDKDENEKDENSSLKNTINKKVFKRAKNRDIFKGMTDEQKEYEAMKLVEAFDRLTRLNTGKITFLLIPLAVIIYQL